MSVNDDGSLTVIGMGLFTSEFLEKELDPNDVIDVSSIKITEQKVISLRPIRNQCLGAEN